MSKVWDQLSGCEPINRTAMIVAGYPETESPETNAPQKIVSKLAAIKSELRNQGLRGKELQREARRLLNEQTAKTQRDQELELARLGRENAKLKLENAELREQLHGRFRNSF